MVEDGQGDALVDGEEQEMGDGESLQRATAQQIGCTYGDYLSLDWWAGFLSMPRAETIEFFRAVADGRDDAERLTLRQGARVLTWGALRKKKDLVPKEYTRAYSELSDGPANRARKRAAAAENDNMGWGAQTGARAGGSNKGNNSG